MRKILLFVTLFVLVGTTFSFAQINPEQKKINDHQMMMRILRNKDRDKSLEITSISLDGDTVSSDKRQVYYRSLGLKKIPVAGKDSLYISGFESENTSQKQKTKASLDKSEESLIDDSEKLNLFKTLVGSIATLLVFFILTHESKK